MPPTRQTTLILLLGALLGFALATGGGVLAARKQEPADLPAQDARLMGEVIERVKDEYVDAVDDHELMRHAIRGMVSGLDSHSAFLDARDLESLRVASEGTYSGIGIEVSYEDGVIVVVAPIEGSPADRAGLQTGDVITAIDGHDVRSAGLDDSIARVRGEPGTSVRLTLERDGLDEPVDYTIERAVIGIHTVRQALLDPGYGYLRITQFNETTPDELRTRFDELRRSEDRPLDGLVLDLRGNPGGVLESGVEVADAFLDGGLIVAASGRSRDSRFHMDAGPGDISGGARMVVLVNGGSASAAEIVAGALRDHGRAVLVGRKTFGKGSVQTILPLGDGQALKLTTSLYYTPSGASIDGRGLVPDVILDKERCGGCAPARASAASPADDPEVGAALDWLKAHPVTRLAGDGTAPVR
jgi:carboxyl-terminal processing protease